jgi:hypothetical protein
MKLPYIKLVFMIVAVISLSACGVKSSVNSPEGATYPAQYPPPLPPIEATPRGSKQNNLLVPEVQDPNSFWQYPNSLPTK